MRDGQLSEVKEIEVPAIKRVLRDSVKLTFIVVSKGAPVRFDNMAKRSKYFTFLSNLKTCVLGKTRIRITFYVYKANTSACRPNCKNKNTKRCLIMLTYY